MRLYKVEIRDKKQGFYQFNYFTDKKSRFNCISWAMRIAEIYDLKSFAIRTIAIV